MNVDNIIKNAKDILKKYPVMAFPEDFNENRTSWEELAEAFKAYYYVIDDISKLKKE